MIFRNTHRIEDTYIDITKNSVNNLGDIIWHDMYIGRARSSYRLEFKRNQDEIENWFKSEYTRNLLNRKNWVDVECMKGK